MKTPRFLLAGLVVFAICGCTTTYVPSPGTPPLKEVQDFPPGIKVAVVNAQSDTNIVLLSKHPNGSTYNANMHDWTDRFVRSMSETLKKKKVAVNDAAPKVMKLSIEKANVHLKAGGWAFQCDLTWKVELSNGKVIPMYLEEGHWKIEDCSNVAVRRACTVVLSNEVVRAFLTGP